MIPFVQCMIDFRNDMSLYTQQFGTLATTIISPGCQTKVFFFIPARADDGASFASVSYKPINSLSV